MQIAIMGASSQISKDLITQFSKNTSYKLFLYTRKPEILQQWLINCGIEDNCAVLGYEKFAEIDNYNAVINFVGVGDPALTVSMGATIFDATLNYDLMALDYVQKHSNCRYIFLSSGAAYGATFDEPVTSLTKAKVAINNLQPQDWYSVAKLYAECRHRALPKQAIVDIRVFNYFSHTQDMNQRFLMCDVVRAIKTGSILNTSSDFMIRDYLHPVDFFHLVKSILVSPPNNAAVDCYTLAPVSKEDLLHAMQVKFGLKYKVIEGKAGVNATGLKPHYFSHNKRAAEFGYIPTLDSLTGVTREVQIILQNS